MKTAMILNAWYLAKLCPPAKKKPLPILPQAREALSRKGFTQREAAEKLGVTLWHLNRVLKGHRESRRILRGIEDLQQKGSKP